MSKKLPVITAKRNGKEYIRSRPAYVSLSEATKYSAKRFGTASRLASQLAASFRPLIAVEQNQGIYHRLLTALNDWSTDQFNFPVAPQKDSHYFRGLRFVKSVSLDARLRLDYTITYLPGSLNVSLPRFVPAEAIYAPAGCNTVTLRWMAVSCLPETGELLRCSYDEINIPYNEQEHAAMVLTLDTGLASGQLVLVALAMFYDNITTGPVAKPVNYRWMPGGIVGSWYE